MVLGLYLNSEIVSGVHCIEKVRGFCFRPVHYFCAGKTRVLAGYHFEKSEESYSYPITRRSCAASIKMAILIVPGLIVGIIAAVVSVVHCFFSRQYYGFKSALTKEVEESLHVKEDSLNPFPVPAYELTPDFSLNKSHDILHKKWVSFISKLTSANSWKQTAMRKEFGELIDEAYKEMDLMLQHAANAANNDPKKMAELMIDQKVWGNKTGENYCLAFFYGSIGDMYSLIREGKYYKVNKSGGLEEVYDVKHLLASLKWNNTKPFFTPGTPEYRWRRLYNAACDLINKYPGLREALQEADKRFVKCAQPDFTPSRLPFADMRPTLSHSS